jgi:3-hydroxy-9,10-secoandrosta-1,3,5(10)-triene-9,17-dione monooxygenase reductase component
MAVAVGKARGPLAAIRATGGFGLSILDDGSRGVMSAFFKPPAEGTTPFDSLETSRTPRGAAVLDRALAWLDCRVTGEHETGDHVVLFGVVQEATPLREGDPSIHLRRNGLDY